MAKRIVIEVAFLILFAYGFPTELIHDCTTNFFIRGTFVTTPVLFGSLRISSFHRIIFNTNIPSIRLIIEVILNVTHSIEAHGIHIVSTDRLIHPIGHAFIANLRHGTGFDEVQGVIEVTRVFHCGPELFFRAFIHNTLKGLGILIDLIETHVFTESIQIQPAIVRVPIREEILFIDRTVSTIFPDPYLLQAVLKGVLITRKGNPHIVQATFVILAKIRQCTT